MSQDSAVRRHITTASLPVIRRLTGLPRLVVPIAAVLLLICGLAGSGWWSIGAMIVLTLALTWLSYLAWPALGFVDRVLRALVVAGLAASAWWRSTV